VTYEIEYYAYGDDDRQPAEEFEDELERSAPKLLGKLQGVTLRVSEELPRSIGGGLWEKCRGYPDLWEVRTIFAKQLARYIAAVDGQHDPPRMVLLAGVAKQTGEPTRQVELARAAKYWIEYQKTRRVSSPDEESTNEPL
jgi:hypothetical protein